MSRTFSFLATVTLLLGGILAACASGSAPRLTGTSWRLVELNGVTLPANVEVALVFDKDSAGGRAACNTYGGSFTQSGSRISFSEIFQTEMWCEGLMDYESAYLSALGSVNSFTLDGDRLSLLGGPDTAALVFVRQ